MPSADEANEMDSLLPRSPSEEALPTAYRKKTTTTSLTILAAAVTLFLAFALWTSSSLFKKNNNAASSTDQAVNVGKLRFRGVSSDNVPVLSESHVPRAACSDGDYSKRTLKLANELPFASLFRDHKDQRKFEASSVVIVNDTAYAVCDSSWAISKFDTKLEPFSEINLQIGDPDREAADSGYEAIFHIEGDKFYVVRESVHHGTRKRDKHHKKRPLAGYHAIIEELVIQGDDYRVVEQCSTELEFEGTSKGFEGAIPIYDLNHELVVLGLCEANHCSEKLKKDRGHGELVAMRKSIDVNGECLWKSIRRIRLPRSAYFQDYSDISLQDESGRVAVVSQEDSKLWVGYLSGRSDAGLWDVEQMEFNPNEGTVYDFPKNHDCDDLL
jgi:hypothetical protein